MRRQQIYRSFLRGVRYRFRRFILKVRGPLLMDADLNLDTFALFFRSAVDPKTNPKPSDVYEKVFWCIRSYKKYFRCKNWYGFIVEFILDFGCVFNLIELVKSIWKRLGNCWYFVKINYLQNEFSRYEMNFHENCRINIVLESAYESSFL